jgi:DNA-binding response OmpR family regulator
MHNPPLILIADDEVDVSEVLQRICIRAGFEVAQAKNGVETVEFCQATPPDLILLDIQMPKLDGWGVIQALQAEEHTRYIPIIVLTAQATKPQDAAYGIELGADDYVVKPFNFHELLARIKAKLRTKRLEERLHQRTIELEHVLRLGADMNRPLELDTLAHTLLDFLAKNMDTDHACLVVFGDTPQKRDVLYLYDIAQDVVSEFHAPSQSPIVMQSSYVLDPDELQERLADVISNVGAFSAMLSPLIHHDDALGYITICTSDADYFDADKLRLMDTISQQTALAVRNTELLTDRKSVV